MYRNILHVHRYFRAYSKEHIYVGSRDAVVGVLQPNESAFAFGKHVTLRIYVRWGNT